MKRSISISVPNPCSENWDKMAPAEKGRFCASCQKTVVDFTLLSDAEILDIFKKAKDNPPCGHFLTSQLNRVMLPATKQHSFGKTMLARVAASLLLIQTAVTTVWAQSAKPKAQIEAQTIKTQEAKGLNKLWPEFIKGCIIDSTGKLGVSGIVVRIFGTDISTSTDGNGYFILRTNKNLPDTIELVTNTADGLGTHIKAKKVNVNTYSEQEGIKIVRTEMVYYIIDGTPIATVNSPRLTTSWQKATWVFHRKKQEAK